MGSEKLPLNGEAVQKIAFDFFTELCHNNAEFAKFFTPQIDEYRSWKLVYLKNERSKWNYCFCYNVNKNRVKLNIDIWGLCNPNKLNDIEGKYVFDTAASVHTKINFIGDVADHKNGLIDCKDMSRDSFFSWLKTASKQMLDFQKNVHDELILSP